MILAADFNRKTQKAPVFQGDSQNVDQVLTRISHSKPRLFKSDSKYVICLLNLVSGTGF